MSEMVVSNGAGALFMPVLDIDQIRAKRKTVSDFYNAVMTRGIDYGVIPGTDKPALHKPGAEKLCSLFGLSVKPEIIEKAEDWTGADHGGEPFFYYHYRVGLYRGQTLITEAEGSCNSFESKYRWRKGERICPTCGLAAIIKGRAEYGGGWLCFRNKGGCGAKFNDGDPSIEAQQTGRVPNPDVADQVNTIQKMALKRAYVAAVLLATGASEFFTQDIEDFQPSVDTSPDDGGNGQQQARAPQNGQGNGHSNGQAQAQRPAAQPSGTTADAQKRWNDACDAAGMDAEPNARHELFCAILTEFFRSTDPKHPGVSPAKKIQFSAMQYNQAADILMQRNAEQPPENEPAPAVKTQKAARSAPKTEQPAVDNRPRCPVPECKNPYEMDCGCTREDVDRALMDAEAARLSGSLDLEVPEASSTVAAMAR